MKFDVITIFPELIEQVARVGVVARGCAAGLIDVAVHDLRDFTDDRHRTVDDAPYGGGPGMVMKAEPFLHAMAHVRATRGVPPAVVLMSPQGAPLTHAVVERLRRAGHVALLCGRYEGVDERVRTMVATEEISIGDYVVSGGELPAAVVLDAVSRLVPGVVGDRESVRGESFVRPLLDYPHYTRPVALASAEVPRVLVSGHHHEIRRWRKREAIRRTLERRPDLLTTAAGLEQLDDEERDILRELTAQTSTTGAGV